MPGVQIAAFPMVEKRQVVGMLLLAAKAERFKLDRRSASRVCSQLGLDGIWLAASADELPAYDDDPVAAADATCSAPCVRDQIRCGGLEQELDSLCRATGQHLRRTEPDLPDQRRDAHQPPPSDFFKQACLDVLEVMGVRGMGVALCGDGQIRPGAGDVRRAASAARTRASARR